MLNAKPAYGFACDRKASGTGYTYTLTTKLGEMLEEVETRFGPRDKSWTVLGIEFCGDHPQLWYPGDCGHISVMLCDRARENNRRAIFQLAHEVIHLLAPTGGRGAPIIEEGLATLFADEISQRESLSFSSDLDSYKGAAALTRQLLQIDLNAIRVLREREPQFVRFTPALLTSAYLSIS